MKQNSHTFLFIEIQSLQQPSGLDVAVVAKICVLGKIQGQFGTIGTLSAVHILCIQIPFCTEKSSKCLTILYPFHWLFCKAVEVNRSKELSTFVREISAISISIGL